MHFLSILFTVYVLLTGATAGMKVKLLIPKTVKCGSTVTLVCQYELEDKPLYAVKWYRGNHEFFRYIPRHTPSMRAFSFPGLEVHMPGSSPHQVTLRNVSANISGLVICEVSTDLTFTTAADSAYLHIQGEVPHKPTLHLSSSVLKPGKDLQVNCSAQLTHPHPVIAFYVDDQKVEPSELREEKPGFAALRFSLTANERSKSYRLVVREHEYLYNPRFRRIWIRCEAIVAGLYLVSSPSIPVLLSFSGETSNENGLDVNEPVLKGNANNLGVNFPIFSAHLYVWCLICALRTADR